MDPHARRSLSVGLVGDPKPEPATVPPNLQPKAQLALAWVLAQGCDIVTIPGTKRVKCMEQTVGEPEINLTVEDRGYGSWGGIIGRPEYARQACDPSFEGHAS